MPGMSGFIAVALTALGSVAVVGCASSSASSHVAAVEVVSVSEIEWGALNPARGASSPRAGTLWGDRAGPGPSGFLVQFADGFSSPAHAHNVTYRGVVISGRVHNDDPGAEHMWMPAGSFWTQPAGEAHVTAASGSENLAYIEIDRGPYLVLPIEEAFDSGERPINVDASNVVWQESWGGGTRVAYLWGNLSEGGARGALVELPAGFRGTVRSGVGGLRAVVIRGRLELEVVGARSPLDPGSYFGLAGVSAAVIASGGAEGCVLYLSAPGEFDIRRQ